MKVDVGRVVGKPRERFEETQLYIKMTSRGRGD
jgi:hypothetical protein